MESSLNPYISLNPYRIIGVLSNSGIKEIHKNLSKLKAYAQLNKKVEFDYDFNELNLALLDRGTELISKAESRILLDENKVEYSLFWFVDINSYDTIALANVKKGNFEKAIEIWEKTIKNAEINSKNFSSYANLSTVLLFNSLNQKKQDLFATSNESINNLQRAINFKIQLINSEYFLEFVLALGVTSKISVSEIQTFFISTVLDILKINFSTKDLILLSEGLNENFSSALNSNLVKEPILILDNNIKNASVALSENEKNGISIGKQLIIDSNKNYIYLKEILGADNFQFQTIADKLANQIIQCGIVCYNATNDDLEYLSSYKYALAIAQFDKTKSRAEEAIKQCDRDKEKEYYNAIEILSSVKDAYLENVRKIDLQVLDMKLAPGQTLNWDKVNEMKKKSLDWNKVTNLIIEKIPRQDIYKIRQIIGNDKSKFTIYKIKVEFILDNLSFIQVMRLKYLCFWEEEDSISKIKFIFKHLSLWVKLLVFFIFSLIIIYFIWGIDGVENVFQIGGIILIFLFVGWLRSL